MMYDKQTVFNEFRRSYDFTGTTDDALIEILNSHYDKVKRMPIDVIKSLLPTPEHTGPGGTYFQDWMIKKCAPTKHFPFTIEASIFDWYGDRTTTDVVHSVGNTEEEIYQRLLIDYLNYLKWSVKEAIRFSYSSDDIQKVIDNITNTINQYGER
ncbi:hypothetical protein [Bacteroides xylanisolvens]|uniref:hypothetical protein n=1 Tax=Bacteroides xylanisolvens TaxID=371601 RepID=UPI001CDC8224|nr:hypothetical protein [Bacteroides xylanisolvens]MCA4468126.1 hypothetical protein [Bacteroides xylanisolvens]MCA4472568.1 hypothetical protein [Bacteroides xylanisolvens]MCA4481718.1 hypothetical protein [Bacteroides xylanisolvens]MCA4521543.1 hypothetical protein [Bacteroides xylanisolvens]MCA4558107.1 hypothetical protein [Bacteroides xylanisolvens]